MKALLQIVQDCVNQLYSDHNAVTENLFQMSRELAKAGGIDDQLSPVAKQLESMAYGVEDLAAGLNTYLKGIDLDPRQLEAVEERLDLLNKLKRKYGGSLATVIAHGQTLELQLNELENLTETLSRIQIDLDKRHLELVGLAEVLSTQRRLAAQPSQPRWKISLRT